MSGVHASAYQLEALRLAALDGETAARVREHVATCLPCRRLAGEIDGAHAHFTQEVALRTSRAVEKRLSPRRRAVRGGAIGAALAVAAMLLLLARAHETAAPPEEPPFVVKGGPSLSLLALCGTVQFAVHDGDALASGDEVRFSLAGVAEPWVLVVSLDGNGTAAVYWPFGGARSAKAGPGATVVLPGSVVLDDSPGPERLFALVSPAPLDAAPVLAALQRLYAAGPSAVRATTHLDGVGEAAQATLLVEKERP